MKAYTMEQGGPFETKKDFLHMKTQYMKIHKKLNFPFRIRKVETVNVYLKCEVFQKFLQGSVFFVFNPFEEGMYQS